MEDISLKDYILMNWNSLYKAENDIIKRKKKIEIEANLNEYMADSITFTSFIKRYTDYTIDNYSFNGIIDAFNKYKKDIKPFDFELRPINTKSKKLILVNDLNYFYDEDDDDLNY